jgi:hypothetical protein
MVDLLVNGCTVEAIFIHWNKNVKLAISLRAAALKPYQVSLQTQ